MQTTTPATYRPSRGLMGFAAASMGSTGSGPGTSRVGVPNRGFHPGRESQHFRFSTIPAPRVPRLLI